MSLTSEWVPYSGNLVFRNLFKIVVKEGKEPHFKEAIRSFDSNVVIKSRGTYFSVETSIDENEIRN